MASREMEPALETRETPLRILIACDTYPPDVNGAAVFCYRLASNLTKRCLLYTSDAADDIALV